MAATETGQRLTLRDPHGELREKLALLGLDAELFGHEEEPAVA
jgi:hypothetical protein